MIERPGPGRLLRGWLQGIAGTGELDSGTDWAKEKVQAPDVPNKVQLIEEMNKLSTMRNPRRVRAKAKAMLKLLPPE